MLAEWRPRMHSYLGGIIRGMNGVVEIVGGVANQEAHHAKYSFVDELKDLLAKAGIEYDEKYLL